MENVLRRDQECVRTRSASVIAPAGRTLENGVGAGA